MDRKTEEDIADAGQSRATMTGTAILRGVEGTRTVVTIAAHTEGATTMRGAVEIEATETETGTETVATTATATTIATEGTEEIGTASANVTVTMVVTATETTAEETATEGTDTVTDPDEIRGTRMAAVQEAAAIPGLRSLALAMPAGHPLQKERYRSRSASVPAQLGTSKRLASRPLRLCKPN